MGTLKNELVLLEEDTQDSPDSPGKWLRIGASTAGGMGLIPGWETKISMPRDPPENTAGHLYCFHHLGNSRSFKSSVPEIVD